VGWGAGKGVAREVTAGSGGEDTHTLHPRRNHHRARQRPPRTHPELLLGEEGLLVAHDARVRGHLLQRDLLLQVCEVAHGRHLDRHLLPAALVAAQVHLPAGALAQLLEVVEEGGGVALGDEGGVLQLALQRRLLGQLGRRPLHVELQHVQHLLRVARHLLLRDAGHGQHGVPLRRQAAEARGRGGVHLHVHVVLDVEGRGDEDAEPVAAGLLLGAAPAAAARCGRAGGTRAARACGRGRHVLGQRIHRRFVAHDACTRGGGGRERGDRS